MARTVQIGKRHWLLGMSWSSFEDTPSKDELQEDAQRLKASWMCVRIGEAAIQAGFCAPLENAKSPSKLFSLAAMLADSREQPWLGIFKINEDTWWYIAVRDGHAILPDGDVVGGEAEIHAARERHSGYSDWKYVEGDLALLEELIESSEGKPTPIRSLSGTRIPLVPAITLALLLVCALGDAYFWHARQKSRQEMARAAAAAKFRAHLFSSNKSAALSPLITTPYADAWLSACGEVISAIPLSSEGWRPDMASCDLVSATVVWARGEGATVAMRPAGALSEDGNTIVQVMALPKIDLPKANEAIDLPVAKVMLRAWAQAANIQLTMNGGPKAPPLPGAVSKASPADGPPMVPVSLNLPLSPFDMRVQIPGLRLTHLKSTDTGEWNVQGVLYGK
jgi:hypothetical protein